jgi:GNAT superfamily N-acetyltransferase
MPYAHTVTSTILKQAAQIQHKTLENECLIVGLEGTVPQAFAQIGDLKSFSTYAMESSPEGGGLIRMFVAQPQYLRVAQDVLSQAEGTLRARGHERLYAFDETSYHFYRYTTPFLTDYWPHIGALFGLNGYKIIHKGISFHWPDYELAEPHHDDSGISIRLFPQDGNGTRPNLTVEALRGDEVICRILMTSLEHFSCSPASNDVCYVDGFGTVDHERRKGIGRYVMEVALYEMRKLDYKHAVLDADSDNYPAQLMYLSMGFQKLSNTYRLRKDML